MSSQPQVRKAVARDLDAILAIEHAWTTTPHWTRAHFEAELASDRSCLCVLEENGSVMGYVAVKWVPPEAQLFNIAVRPDLAGRGWGKKLIAYVHENAAREKCDRVMLEVSEKNVSAVRLYGGCGYQIVGRRPKYYNDGSSALLMESKI